MATSIMQGKTFEIDGKELNIFGHTGYNDGNSWVMNVFGGVRTQVRPAPVKTEIEEVIEQDRAAGREELIDSVRVNPNTAVRLWCEGVLTKDMFAKAVEDENGVTLMVMLGGKERKLIVQNEDDTAYAFATCDVNGGVV